MSAPRPEITIESLNRLGPENLPARLGIEMLELLPKSLRSRMPIAPLHMAPNGFLHAASVVALADTTCGYATFAHLPSGATSFTTIELKSNHLGTAREGAITCVATAQHLGRTTQVWDAVVSDEADGRTIALFRCTQMILWPREAAASR